MLLHFVRFIPNVYVLNQKWNILGTHRSKDSHHKNHSRQLYRRGSTSTTVIQIFNKMSRTSSTTSFIPDVGGQPHYSPTTGLVYIFNLIVGTGALTIPKAFNDVG